METSLDMPQTLEAKGPRGTDQPVPSQGGRGKAERVNNAGYGLPNTCESTGPVPIVKLITVNLLALHEVGRGLANAGLRKFKQSLGLFILPAGFSEP